MTYSLYENKNETSPIDIIIVSTASGVTLNAIWKQRNDRWYIVEPEENRGNLNNVVDTLTPRQFQHAIEDGKYTLKW